MKIESSKNQEKSTNNASADGIFNNILESNAKPQGNQEKASNPTENKAIPVSLDTHPGLLKQKKLLCCAKMNLWMQGNFSILLIAVLR